MPIGRKTQAAQRIYFPEALRRQGGLFTDEYWLYRRRGHGQRLSLIHISTIQNLSILANYFHVSTDYLLDRTDVETPWPPKSVVS